MGWSMGWGVSIAYSYISVASCFAKPPLGLFFRYICAPAYLECRQLAAPDQVFKLVAGVLHHRAELIYGIDDGQGIGWGDHRDNPAI